MNERCTVTWGAAAVVSIVGSVVVLIKNGALPESYIMLVLAILAGLGASTFRRHNKEEQQ